MEQLREQQNAVAAQPVRTKTPEEIAKEVEYWQKVFAEKPARSEIFVSRRTLQEMPFEEARRKFWSVMQMRAAHIAVLENNPDFEWRISQDFSAILRNLVKYFINDPSGEYPPNKGLFVYGRNGTGKTEILTALKTFCEQNSLSKGFVLCSMSDVYNRTRADKEYDPIEDNQQFDRCFDEFSRYVGPVIRYGDPLDINEAIIEARYTRFRNYGQLTHFISNATPNETESRLSPMVFDRLRSMCTGIEFPGGSNR